MPTVDADGTGAFDRAADRTTRRASRSSRRRRSSSPRATAARSGASPRSAGRTPLGAREYRIQVDDDPTFGSPIDDVLTNATALTSTSTYPADTVLYWRVRANDENKVGLDLVGHRQLPPPAAHPRAVGDNPAGGEAIPVLVMGCPSRAPISYDMHVEQADGTKRDFTMRSTAFTPIVLLRHRRLALAGARELQVRLADGLGRFLGAGAVRAPHRHADRPPGLAQRARSAGCPGTPP